MSMWSTDMKRFVLPNAKYEPMPVGLRRFLVYFIVGGP